MISTSTDERSPSRVAGVAPLRRRSRGRLLPGLSMLWMLVVGPPAEAHPVAQGSMEVTVFPDRVVVVATVSSEEVLVAASSPKGAGSRKAAERSHGDYLLAHLRIE